MYATPPPPKKKNFGVSNIYGYTKNLARMFEFMPCGGGGGGNCCCGNGGGGGHKTLAADYKNLNSKTKQLLFIL
jgi:hypothetical protein